MFANDCEYATVAYISALDVNRSKRKEMRKHRFKSLFVYFIRLWLLIQV